MNELVALLASGLDAIGLEAARADPAARGLALAGGVLLLVAGRRLFWLAVAAAGFVFGAVVAARFTAGAEPLVTLVVALVLGLAGALLAGLAQRLAVVIAGFVLGAVAADKIVVALALPVGDWHPLVVLVAAVIAALAAQRVFELALRLATAGIGAALVVAAAHLPPIADLLVFAALWVIGFAAQRERRPLRE